MNFNGLERLSVNDVLANYTKQKKPHLHTYLFGNLEEVYVHEAYGNTHKYYTWCQEDDRKNNLLTGHEDY